MSINDPLGDMLTRIRNAQMRHKAKVTTPASSLREHVLDVLEEEGYHPRLCARRLQRRPVRVRDRAQVFRRRAGDPEIKRVSKPGRRVYSVGRAICRPCQRARRRHPLDAEGRHVRRRRPRPRMSAARSSAAFLGPDVHEGRIDVAHWQEAGAFPSGVTAAVERPEVTVKGPKGELKHVLVDDVIAKLEDGSDRGCAARGHASARVPCGACRGR